MKQHGNMMKKLVRTLCFVLAVLSSCPAAAGQADDSHRYAPKFKKLMAEIMAEYDVPGMAMAIRFADGSSLDYAAGLADRNTGERLTADHHFRIGSATKTITATAALLLCERGAFSLDDRVADLLPGIKEFGTGGLLHGSPVTVRMLLQHTSGLRDYVEGEIDGQEVIDIMVEKPLSPLDPRDLVTASVHMGSAGTPGEAFAYSNTNYILLGLLIEKFSGQSFARFVRQNICDPLALKETRVPETCDMPAPYTHGYLEKDGDGRLYDYTRQHPSGVWAAGNVISTPRELLKYLEALVQGSLLTPEFKARQFAIREFPEGRLRYGLGVADFGGPVGHNGTVMGYQTWMVAYRGMYVVIYNNCLYASKNVHVSGLLFDRFMKVISQKE